MEPEKKEVKTLVERLAAGENIICAEGYLLALSRMGYIAHGIWAPQFLLDHSEVLRMIHYEFVHAGTDVTVAYQYNTHREKMREIGLEDELEKVNRIALKLAREVANDTGTLMAGNVCSTRLYEQGGKEKEAEIRSIFEEQVCWAKDEGADYIIAETFSYFREVEIALEVILSFDLPAVCSISMMNLPDYKTLDDIPIAQACRMLLDKGATLVGTNCFRGPNTMLKVIKEIVKEVPPEKICALPVMYRTTDDSPTFFDFDDKACPINNPVYPLGLDAFQTSTREVVAFTKRCKEIGLKYVGLCCGNTGNYTRAMADTLGRKPPAIKYLKPDFKVRNPLQRKILYEKERLST